MARLKEGSTAEDFHKAFESAMQGSPYSQHVTHYTPEEISGMKDIHLTPDGKSGFLVKDHGDGNVEATALFNVSGEKGRGRKLLDHAVNNLGVNYVEAYGPDLPKLYNQVGFQTSEQYPFDRSMASPDWNYDRFGTPDYHIMRRQQ